MKHDFRKEPISRKLRTLGFSSLQDKDLIAQMAVCVRDHAHLRTLLLAVVPEKRTIAYEAFRSQIRQFVPKPLHEYLAEGAMLAEQAKLPVWDEKNQTVTDYKDYHGGKTQLEVLAMRAIHKNARENAATGQLQLVCSKCTERHIFPALDKINAYAYARKLGWVFQMRQGGNEEVAICPKCPAARVEMVLA